MAVSAFFLGWAVPALGTEVPLHVTSERCAECHQAQYTAWADSHHAWAWRLPTAPNVLADFNDAVFEHQGFRYRFETRPDGYYVVADGPDGVARPYRVQYVVGVTPLQQYLVDTGKGRLQALDLAWDTERSRWYHLYSAQDTGPGNGMHWSGSYKNWNARCAECHATDFHKHYDPRSDAYDSRQAEIGVGCEACHGPGSAHLAWAGSPEDFRRGQWQGVDEKGLTAAYDKEDPASRLNLCAACHSRREPLGADSPPAGAGFHDHFRLSLLDEGLYFADGQILEEVYVLGSFLQSRMHAAGVTCTHCHDAHSYRLKAEGNGVCTQCHNPGGNPAFPSLLKQAYDDPGHHFHPAGSAGASCPACHMPERQYMVVDGRRDHGFRVPRPDLSQRLGTPDPCLACHADRDSAWSAAEIRARFPAGRLGSPHFADSLAAARRGGGAGTADALLGLARDATHPAIVRASALRHLGRLSDGPSAQSLAPLLADEDPLLRTAALNLLRRGRGGAAQALIASLLADPVRSVRHEAALGLVGADAEDLPADARQQLGRAMRELQQALLAKADFPETQLVLGGIALTLRNFEAAEGAFERAAAMDPQRVEAWDILARIRGARGDRDGAAETLRRALRHNPGQPAFLQALAELGE
jgi:hypothetical protein